MVQSEKMAALGTMSAGIAHEINSPLAVILLSAEQGKDLSTDPNIDRLFTVIEDTSKRIVTIIKGLLKFTHSSEKEQPEKITEEDLINDTLTLCKQRFADNFVELSFGRSGGPFWINGHSVQLVQVLVSLLNNSFDAVKDLKEKWVKLEVSGNDTVVELVVTDSGMMIPAEIQAKVFDPFFTTKEVGSGTGLGLSIAKGIIESHQGTINLDTHSEHTRFVIQLPTHASQGTR
jgi:C4-dicarboxylate-specific signal transduction histidine kinase